MTREEIADKLFDAAKEVKQSFLGVMEASRMNGAVDGLVYTQYVQILKNLNLLYQSMGTVSENFDERIEALSKTAAGLPYMDVEDGHADEFTSEFVSVLNDMLMSTIRLRQKYCLIRRNDAVPGLASHIITNLGQIAASLNHGYIPVIDTVNADNILSGLSRQYAVNAWELYFKQPLASLSEEIVRSKEVRLLEGIPGFMPSYDMDCLMNPELMDYWRHLMKEYMPVSAALEERVQENCSALPFGDGEKILGVLCRGTDYTNIRPYHHPVQPSLEAVLAKADEMMRRHSCSYCYLATEDKEIRNAFRSKWKEKLLTTQEIYYEADLKDSINQTNMDRHVDIHEKNMEYLTALILLSKCRYFIGGRTSGTVVSLLLSDGFRETHIWDCGRYGIDDSLTLRSHIG